MAVGITKFRSGRTHTTHCQMLVGDRHNLQRMQEPYKVDGILEGTWGTWAIEIQTGAVRAADLQALLEFSRRHPSYRPLLLCDAAATVESIYS